MTRDELEHIIRASADVTNQYEFMIIGSQSILGSFPHPEAVFTMSAEADIYPLNAPELAVMPAQALALVVDMPLDEDQQRRLRATIRRWAKSLGDAGPAS